MLTVTAQIKDRFFDRQRVIEAIGRENTRKLGRMGAFVRRRGISLLRRTTTKSTPRRPGLPPKVRAASGAFATLKNILYGLGADENSVVIGPRAIPRLRPRGSSAHTVPELLTHGGFAQLDQYSDDGEHWLFGKSSQATYHRTVLGNYDKHPWMGPALDMEIAAGTIDSVWSVKVHGSTKK